MQVELPHDLPLFKGEFFGDGFEIDFFGRIGRGEDEFLQFGVFKENDDDQMVAVEAGSAGGGEVRHGDGVFAVGDGDGGQGLPVCRGGAVGVDGGFDDAVDGDGGFPLCGGAGADEGDLVGPGGDGDLRSGCGGELVGAGVVGGGGPGGPGAGVAEAGGAVVGGHGDGFP